MAKKRPFKKVVDKIKTKGKSLGQDAPFVVLLPFKPIMKHVLDAHHIAHADTLKDISIQFARHIHDFNNFDSIALDGLSVDETTAQGSDGSVQIIKTVISTVVTYFKNLKAKKDSGQKLTKEEETMLASADKVADQIKSAGEDEAQSTIAEMIRDFVFSWKGGLSAIALIALIYFTFFNKKK